MARSIFVLAVAMLTAYSTFAQVRLAGECATICNDLRLEVLTLEICRTAKTLLPRPKIGDFCNMGMEQGFSDACVALCMNERPQSRIAQTCRSAAIEMPRPTVRQWCEHGYTTAFDKTRRDLGPHFRPAPVPPVETKKSEPAETIEEKLITQDNSETKDLGKIIASVPVTVDEETIELNVHEGQSAEDAVVLFCRKHLSDDLSACIRQLLPNVLSRLESLASDPHPEVPLSSEASDLASE